jgi:RNA polymerase sigma factor (sigma-70 family)
MTPLLSSTLLRGQTDERLVELAASGHDRAFEAIVERYRRPLLRYLRRLLSDTLAEDVVQATFINAWSSLRTGTEVRELRPWLYRIAHNAAINALKKVGEAMEEVPESVGGFATEPATELERRDEMHRALTSIAALPSRQRTALLAVAVDGRAHSEVAQELGLTDGAVRQLVHRARTTLRGGITAITPMPVLHMLMASSGDSTVARVAEVAAGAGGAGAASVSLKAGAAAVIATGALVTGGPQLAHVVKPADRPAASAAATPPAGGASRSAQAPTVARAVPAAVTHVLAPAASAPTASGSPASSSSSTADRSGRSHRRRGPSEHQPGSSSSGHRRGGDGGEGDSHKGDGGSGSGTTRGSSGSGHDGGGEDSSGGGSSGEDTSGGGSSGGESSARGSSPGGDSSTGDSSGGSSSGGGSSRDGSSSGSGGATLAGTRESSSSGGEARAPSVTKKRTGRTRKTSRHHGGNAGHGGGAVAAPPTSGDGDHADAASQPATSTPLSTPTTPQAPAETTGEVRTADGGGGGGGG